MGFIKMFIAGVLILLSFGGGFWFNSFLDDLDLKSLDALGETGIAGFAVENSEEENLFIEYTWTTALCGSNNKCLDVLVSCNGTQIMNVTPISKVVEHELGWEDPRAAEGVPDLCGLNHSKS